MKLSPDAVKKGTHHVVCEIYTEQNEEKEKQTRATVSDTHRTGNGTLTDTPQCCTFGLSPLAGKW